MHQCSVYAGNETILIPPTEVEQSPALWLSTLSQEKVRDTFCSYGIMELCVRELASQVSFPRKENSSEYHQQVNTLRERGISLSSLRTCVVVAEERPRIVLVHAFAKLFQPLGLKQSVLSTSFGCRASICTCTLVSHCCFSSRQIPQSASKVRPVPKRQQCTSTRVRFVTIV